MEPRFVCRSSGFTLIELLISMVLMTLIMLVGTSSYLLYANAWKRNSQQFDISVNKYREIELASIALDNTVPFYVESGELPAFYFLGRREGFTGVTSSSVVDPNQMAVYRLFKEPTEGGKYRLVYEEAGINEPLMKLEQQLPFNYRAVLFDGVDRLDFKYYGWKNRREQLTHMENMNVTQNWFTEYDGASRLSHPTEILVQVNSFEWHIRAPDMTLKLLSQQEKVD